MGGATLTTDRLTLRPVAREDAARIAELIAPWEVVRWLTGAPHPYRLADAEGFVAAVAGAPDHRAITSGPDGLMGLISLRPGQGLGYWLGQPFWGQGYMQEAARAVLNARFAASALPVLSGYLPGNTRSAATLTRLGFLETDLVEVTGAKGPEKVQRMQLTAARWRLSRGEA